MRPMTDKRKKLIARFQQLIDCDPRKQIFAALCANIAEDFCQDQTKQVEPKEDWSYNHFMKINGKTIPCEMCSSNMFSINKNKESQVKCQGCGQEYNTN